MVAVIIHCVKNNFFWNLFFLVYFLVFINNKLQICRFSILKLSKKNFTTEKFKNKFVQLIKIFHDLKEAIKKLHARQHDALSIDVGSKNDTAAEDTTLCGAKNDQAFNSGP